MLIEKIIPCEARYTEIEQMLTLPDVVADAKKYTALIKEYNSLSPLVTKYREYKAVSKASAEALEIKDDSSLDKEFRELAEEEYTQSLTDLKRLEEELKILLIPKDPNDDRNVIVEIRQGAGGEEAALFAADL